MCRVTQGGTVRFIFSLCVGLFLMVAPASSAIIYDDIVGAPRMVPNLHGPTQSTSAQAETDTIPEPAAFGFVLLGLIAMIFVAGGGGRVNSVRVRTPSSNTSLVPHGLKLTDGV